MSKNKGKDTSRRAFLKKTGCIAAGTALAGVRIPRVHAAENHTIQLALIGCGARGTGAAAIRDDKPYNEVHYGVEASVVSNMGRKAAHTGRIVTYDEMLHDDLEYAPGADKFTADSPAPVRADADGRYPVPQPGIITLREY